MKNYKVTSLLVSVLFFSAVHVESRAGSPASCPIFSIEGLTGVNTAERVGGIVDTSRVVDLDEVVVVSQPKEVLSLRQQPLSSSVFTGRDLGNLGVRDLGDLSAYVPSFVMPSYGSRLTSSVYVRGIGSRVNNPAVGIYVDGIPLVSKNSYNFHAYQIDRIDVLRGPQGTLYGMNTEGGLVRLYSKNPMKYRGTDIRVGVGTHFYRNIEFAHYHDMADNIGFSVAGFYTGQNGFFRNSTTGRRADTSDEAGGKANFIWQPTTRFTLNLVADYQHARQEAFPYGVYDTDTRDISAPSTNRPNGYRRNMFNAGLGLVYNADGLTLTSQTSYQFLKDCMDMDQDYLPQDYMHLCQRQMMNALTQELTLKSSGDAAWQHSSGVYFAYQWLRTSAPVYFDDDFTSRISTGIGSAMYAAIYQAMVDRMTSAGMPQSVAEGMAANAIEQAGGVSADVSMSVPALFHTPQANVGIYHESNIRLVPRLNLTLGLRYDYNRVNLSYDTSASMAVTANVMGASATNTLTSALLREVHDDYGQLLPKVGLSYTVDRSGSNIYATVSKGYRAGGYNIQMFSDILQSELTANSSNAMAGDYEVTHTDEDYARVNNTITYKPEESWNYEVGAHLNLFGGMMQADLAAYYMTIRNQQLSVMAGDYGFGRMMVNAGRSRSLGFEAALRGSAIDNRLSWAATYAYTRATFTEYSETDDGNTVSYEGNRIPFVPGHTISARADMRFPLARSSSRSIIVGADVTAQGPIYWDEANTTKQPFYALLGLHAGVQWGNTVVRLWCRNVTNTRFATFAFSSSASGRELWFAQRGNPVQAGIDLQLHI